LNISLAGRGDYNAARNHPPDHRRLFKQIMHVLVEHIKGAIYEMCYYKKNTKVKIIMELNCLNL
jgi:hypothetical protein